MKKDEALKHIKKKVDSTFSSHSEAARFFGVTPANFSLAINGHRAEIPDYLCQWAGFGKTITTTYWRIK